MKERIWTSQPQVVVPIAGAFRAYKPRVVLLPAAGARNLATNSAAPFVNDAATLNGAFELPGANGYIDLGAGNLVAQDAHTMLAVCRLDSFPSAYPILASYNVVGGTGRVSCFFSTDATYSDFSFGSVLGGGTAKVSLTGSGPVLGTERAIVVVRSGTAAANHKIFVNGTQITAATSGTHSAQSGNSVLGQASTSSLTNDFDGRIRVFVLFDAILPDAIARRLSENPWQVFAPLTRPPFVSPGGATAYSLVITPGSYSITGQDVGLIVSRTLSIDAGAYALTGQDAGLQASKMLQPEAGSYTLTGHDADLLAARALAATAGAYALTGLDAGLLSQRVLSADAGAYVITGLDAGLIVTPVGSYSLQVDAGAYAITGNDATLLSTRLLSIDAGAYALTGGDATLTYSQAAASYSLQVDAGAYALTGQDAGLYAVRALAPESGSYALTGRVATLTYSGDVVVVQAAISAARRSRTGASSERPAQLSAGRRPPQ